MQAHDITYPSSIGTVVAAVRAYLTAKSWTGVTTQPKLPSTKTARMVTVRDDGGPSANGITRRRHGFNIWADSPVDAENLAITVAECCRSSLKAVEVSGPTEVTDSTDDVMVVDGKTLFHYFVSAVIAVRATNL